MRSIQKIAFIYGVINLVLGITTFTGVLVTGNRQKGLNTRPGRFLGLWAVNPPHAIMHLLMGAVGVGSRWMTQLARPSIWINAVGYLLLAVVGWITVGVKPGIHKVMGIALDWRDNVLHTVWGASALLLATQPQVLEREPYMAEAILEPAD